MKIEVGNKVEFKGKGGRKTSGIVVSITAGRGAGSRVGSIENGDPLDVLIVSEDGDDPRPIFVRDVERVFVRRNVKIASTKIVRDEDGEYRVKAFDASGKRIPSADYFTDDRDDARATAKAMIGDLPLVYCNVREPVETTIGELGIEFDEADRFELLAIVRYWGEVDVADEAFDAIPVRMVVSSLERDTSDYRADTMRANGLIDNIAARLLDTIRPIAERLGVELDETVEGN